MTSHRHIAFDVDGVLLDTDGIHETALNEALRAVAGLTLPHDEHLARWKGLPTRVKLATLVQDGRLTTHQATQVIVLKQGYTLPAIAGAPVDPQKVRLLAALKERGANLCAVSNAVADTVAAMLDRVGATPFLDFWLSNEDAVPKPDPALYLLAARRFGIAPSELVVVEDGAPGVEAATRAGCRVVAVRGPADVTLDLLRRL